MRRMEGENPGVWECGNFEVLFFNKLPKRIHGRLMPKMVEQLPRSDRITVEDKPSQEMGKEEDCYEYFQKRRGPRKKSTPVVEGTEMITQTHTVRGKKRGREKSRESDTACQTKKGRVKEEEAQQFSLKKTVEGRSFREAAGEPMEVEIGQSRRSVTRPAEAEKEMDQMVVRGSGSVCRERSESDEERRKQMWSVRGQREEASTKAPSYTLSSFVARHVKERSPEEDAERRGDQRRANQKKKGRLGAEDGESLKSDGGLGTVEPEAKEALIKPAEASSLCPQPFSYAPPSPFSSSSSFSFSASHVLSASSSSSSLASFSSSSSTPSSSPCWSPPTHSSPHFPSAIPPSPSSLPFSSSSSHLTFSFSSSSPLASFSPLLSLPSFTSSSSSLPPHTQSQIEDNNDDAEDEGKAGEPNENEKDDASVPLSPLLATGSLSSLALPSPSPPIASASSFLAISFFSPSSSPSYS